MDSKLKLLYFRYFFCGRDDVYAYLVPGKGYRPRRRPKYDLTDNLLVQHMLGNVMLGAYPMLRGNETLWIAADFDGTNDNAFEEAWMLKQVLEEHDIKPLCNTSQSGKGVHVRVIFKKPMPAWLARNLMEAFREREGIRTVKEGGAFDRFFPAQDKLDPRDFRAIGNQIGMPLNKRAAEQRGGCMILDDDFNKIELGDDVWNRLEQYTRVKRSYVTDALAEIDRYNLLLPKDEINVSSEEFWGRSYTRDYGGDAEKIDFSKFTSADLRFIVHNCDFMDYCKSEYLSYNEWLFLASVLTRFDDCGGREVWHALSSLDSRYDENQADKKYDNVLLKIKKPSLCSTLSSYGWTCPSMGADGACNKFRNDWGRGPRTPATICHFVELVEVA